MTRNESPPSDRSKSAPASEPIRKLILSATKDGNLLQHLSTVRFDVIEPTSEALAELHNTGDLDLLSSLRHGQLRADGPHVFHKILELFRRTLPLIDCDVSDALAAVNSINRRLTDGGAAATAHEALHGWLEKQESRPKQALSLVLRDNPLDDAVLRVVLTVGGRTDPDAFTTQAVTLSRDTSPATRGAALFALGRIVPLDNDTLVARALRRLEQAVTTSASESETQAAVESALSLFERAPDRLASNIEPIVAAAAAKRSPSVRNALALGLLRHHAILSTHMIDAIFSALGHADLTELDTITNIDLVLYQWDIDADRDRICTLIQSLFTHRDNPLSVSHLDNFRHKLGEAEGQLLGWYVFSLLSSGDDRLCEAAAELLPYKEARPGIDIDLSATAPHPAWVPYLARKVLAYCLFKRECAAGLLLSCLRAVSDEHRHELEGDILDSFLINYLHAIEFFRTAVDAGDPAKRSVDFLARRLESYERDLERLGTCPSFAPSERERHLQAYRHRDFMQDVHKRAEQNSIFSFIAHKSILLYGSASVAHVRGADGNTHRQEMRFAEHKHFFEFPRLSVIDPVGLHFRINRFKLERPPS